MTQTKDSVHNPFDVARWRKTIASERHIQPKYSFTAKNLNEAKRWQRALRRQFIKRLGGFPAHDVPLRPRLLARDECDDYTRESLTFMSREGLPVFAYFLLPKGATAPLPTILCLHGHGYGVDAIVGLDGKGGPLKGKEYQNSFGLQAVRHGYAVLAIEVLGFGRRREGEFEGGSRASSCQTLSGTALMVGQTMAGWRVYDAIRALDYLETRPEVDQQRIGAMGISGGGLNTLYLTAVDERVSAAMVSGFMNTFRDSLMAIVHCVDNFVPGLLQDAEMTDVAGLVAPRALWCENGTKDSIFPVAAFRRALRDVQKIYKVFGVPERCAGEVFEGEHCFHGVGAWPFLEKYLKHG